MVLLYELNRNNNRYSKEETVKIIKDFNNQLLLDYYHFYSKLPLKDDYDLFVLEEVGKEILSRMN